MERWVRLDEDQLFLTLVIREKASVCSLFRDVRSLGFETRHELCSLIGQMNISTDEDLLDFCLWKKNDGTKKGLLKLIKG